MGWDGLGSRGSQREGIDRVRDKVVPEIVSVDTLIEEIRRRHWVCKLEPGHVMVQNATPLRYIATSFRAWVTTPAGDAEWEDWTPYLALEGALSGAKRMHGEPA